MLLPKETEPTAIAARHCNCYTRKRTSEKPISQKEVVQPGDMVDNKKKVPEPYEKNAPRFDDENPEELPQFLEHIERMMELEETPETEKNVFVCRYANRKTREEWKQLETYTKSYKEFKKEIFENYPSSVDRMKGSMLKLRRILDEFVDGDISISDPDELMKLTRSMNAESSKLFESKLLADPVAVTMFLDKLSPRFREKILDNLERHLAVASANDSEDTEEQIWTLKEVMNEAKKMVRRQARTLDFFQKGRVERSNGRSSSSKPLKKEESENALATIESIKTHVVTLMERLEAQTTQKLSEIDENNRKKMEELEQFYKSLAGRATGASDSQILSSEPTQMSNRQQVNMQNEFVQCAAGGYRLGPVEENDVYGGYYCDPPGYDPRDDEIQTMRVEQAKLKRQLAHLKQLPQLPRMVPPALVPAQPTTDMGLISSLVAATLAKANAMYQPQERLGQTRAIPFRTGNSSESDEDF